MTDSANCGTCGHDCLGATCTAGVCPPTTFATDTLGPIAADDAYVYWATSGGTVSRCLVSGCAGSPTVIATGQVAISSIAIDAAAVYWTVGYPAGGSAGLPFAVLTCPLTGCTGSPTTLVTDSASNYGGYVVSDGTSVFYTEAAPAVNASKLMKVPAGGGAPVMLAPSVGGVFAIDATAVYFTAGCGTSWPCLEKIGKDGTGLATLNQDADGTTVAVDGSYVYFTSINDATNGCNATQCLIRANKDGTGGAEMQGTMGTDVIHVAAVNGCGAFWTTYGLSDTWLTERPVGSPGVNGLYMPPSLWDTSASPQQIGHSRIGGIAANATKVFFTVPGSSEVLALPR